MLIEREHKEFTPDPFLGVVFSLRGIFKKG
jgi:hypothetical protein